MSAPATRRAGGVLAIDHGTKRTGFAVADALRIGTFALDTFHGDGAGEPLLNHVAALCEERTIGTFLIGLPCNVDGTDGGRATDVRAFAARLAARFPRTALVFHDERLTSKAADELLVESGHTGAARKARRDSWSALVLLRDWIGAGEP